MNCQTLDFCLSVFCIVKLWTREVSANHATISILNLRLLRLSLLKGAVPTVLSSLSAPSLLSYVPRSLNPHLCFSASSHLICFPAPAVLSLACPCSLLLTCSCESSWNKVQPLTPPAVSCFLGTACLFSSWPHLPVDQVCLSVFFSSGSSSQTHQKKTGNSGNQEIIRFIGVHPEHMKHHALFSSAHSQCGSGSWQGCRIIWPVMNADCTHSHIRHEPDVIVCSWVFCTGWMGW